MVFARKPVELQMYILQEINDVNTLLNLSLTNTHVSSLVFPLLRKAQIGYCLRQILIRNRYSLLKKWKKYVFDTIPMGDASREIIVHAFFFLLGYYRIDDILYTQIFSPYIRHEDYDCAKTLGRLFLPESLYFRHRLGYSALDKRSLVFADPLFEHIVGIKDFLKLATCTVVLSALKNQHNPYLNIKFPKKMIFFKDLIARNGETNKLFTY